MIRHEGPENAVRIRQNIKLLIAQIKASGCENVLISEEIFCEHLCSDFSDLFRQFDIKVIVYLRSPALLEHSAIQFEAFSFLFDSRSPIGISPLGRLDHQEDCLYRVYSTFYKLRSNWLNHLKPDAVIYKDFDAIVQSGDLIADFLSIFGLTDIDATQAVKVNDALKPQYLLFHGHLNMVPLTWPDRVRLYENLLELSRSDTKAKSYRFLSDDQLASVSRGMIDLFDDIGRLIAKPDFYSSGVRKLKELEFIPYRNLPAQLQHDIFSRLEEDVRQSISESWWKVGTVPSTMPLFPDFPETEAALQALGTWHRKLNLATR